MKKQRAHAHSTSPTKREITSRTVRFKGMGPSLANRFVANVYMYRAHNNIAIVASALWLRETSLIYLFLFFFHQSILPIAFIR